MFIKPSQKLKRVLRVHLIFDKQENEDTIKIIGGMYPPKAPDANNIVSVPKLTSFFKQIAFVYAGESQPFVTVQDKLNLVEKTYKQLHRTRWNPIKASKDKRGNSNFN